MLGGETSGHLLCLDRTTTGDALISALQVLAIMKQTGRSLAELAAPMPKYPQVLENVRSPRRIDPTQVAADPGSGGAGRRPARRQRPDRAAAVGHRTGDPRHGRRQRRETGAGDCQGAGGLGGLGGRRRPESARRRHELVLLSGNGAVKLPRLFSGRRAAKLPRPSRGPTAHRGTAMRRPFVAGNWKMHGSRAENAELIEALLLGLPAQTPVEIAVCPPFVYLWEDRPAAEVLEHRARRAVGLRRAGRRVHRRSVGGHAQGRRLQVRDRRSFRASRHL